MTSILTTSKNNHIPKKIKKFNKRKHKKENWMTDELLILVNRKNDMYRDWKSTSNDYEYQIKKINFKTFDKIVNCTIDDAKNKYYHDLFTRQKNDMKKTWQTINETLNRSKNKGDLPSEFTVGNETINNPKQIANHFNDFFANIGVNLSSKIDLNGNGRLFTDYLSEPSTSRLHFKSITEEETLSTIK